MYFGMVWFICLEDFVMRWFVVFILLLVMSVCVFVVLDLVVEVKNGMVVLL